MGGGWRQSHLGSHGIPAHPLPRRTHTRSGEWQGAEEPGAWRQKAQGCQGSAPSQAQAVPAGEPAGVAPEGHPNPHCFQVVRGCRLAPVLQLLPEPNSALLQGRQPPFPRAKDAAGESCQWHQPRAPELQTPAGLEADDAAADGGPPWGRLTPTLTSGTQRRPFLLLPPRDEASCSAGHSE